MTWPSVSPTAISARLPRTSTARSFSGYSTSPSNNVTTCVLTPGTNDRPTRSNASKRRCPEITWLTFEQIDEQLTAVEDRPIIHPLVATYIYAGLRRAEALWLTTSDIDFDRRIIRIRGKTIEGASWSPKTRGSTRAVPINSTLFAILDEYRRRRPQSSWLFPAPEGSRWDPDNLSRDLRAVNDAAGLDWSCLDYRHTFGSHLAQRGISLYKISKLMGNSPEICRRHYAALVPEAMHDDVEFSSPPTPVKATSSTNTNSLRLRLVQ